VAWLDFGFSDLNSPEIVAYDRATGATTRLTNDALLDWAPAVDPSGTVITWAKCHYLWAPCDIWDATLQGGVWITRQLTTDGTGEMTGSRTNGSVVVYASSRDGDQDIRCQPVGGGPEQSISLPGNDSNPHVSGNLVTFEHYDATDYWEIYAYDLSTNALYRLNSSYIEALNDVWSGPDGSAHVVWSALGYEGDNTYSRNVYELSFVVPSADTTAPTITIASPTDHGAYTLNQAVPAGYTCADEPGGSGTASCQGTVPAGAAIDTASVGTKTFTITAADNAGNTSTASAAYSVGYRICPLFDQTRSHRSGSTVPVKLQLCDASGANLSATGTTVNATALTKKDSTASPQPATDAGNANPDNNFRYDASMGGYIYNLSTKGLGTGTWVLSFTVVGDPVAHSVQFDVQ